MYIHFFENDLERDTVQTLIDRLEEKKEQGIRLHICTDGGYIDAAKCLVDYLNHNKNHIQVVLTCFIMSSGTFFLVDLERPAEISSELEYIMFHRFDHREYTTRKVNGWFDKEKRRQGTDWYNNIYIEKFRKLGLTEEELERYVDGQDVYLYREDFERLNITAAE